MTTAAQHPGPLGEHSATLAQPTAVALVGTAQPFFWKYAAGVAAAISSREVNAALRQHVWPELRQQGFTSRTQRTAWRHGSDVVAVVNFGSFNSYIAESIGVTPFSFSVRLGIRARASRRDREFIQVKDGDLRPREEECDVRRVLWKRLVQPESEWPDVWYVRRDGSNLREVVEDARAVLLGEGLRWIDEFSDLRRLLAFARSEPEEWNEAGTLLTGTWGPGQVGSPMRRDLIADLTCGHA
jgi:hypothetical protein